MNPDRDTAKELFVVVMFAGLLLFLVFVVIAAKKLNISRATNFLVATVGDGGIGLAIGANLLLFSSWQRGLLGGFAQSKSNEFSVNLYQWFLMRLGFTP